MGMGDKKRNSYNLNNLSKRSYSTSQNKLEVSESITEFIKLKQLKPVYIYEDLEKESTKIKIKTETLNLSGIYLIFNKYTLDYYIGSAATNKFYSRFSNHLINYHGSKIVKNVVKKYKLSSFAFLILEIFPDIVNKENNKQLLNLEDFYLKSLLPNYNILTEAGSSFGYKHTEITRIKMVSNYSEERRQQIEGLDRGNKLSFDTTDAIRKAALSRKKTPLSKEALQNLKKASKPILVKNLDGTVYGEFPSIIEATKDLNCSQKTIYRSLKSEKKLLKRHWIVSFIQKP